MLHQQTLNNFSKYKDLGFIILGLFISSSIIAQDDAEIFADQEELVRQYGNQARPSIRPKSIQKRPTPKAVDAQALQAQIQRKLEQRSIRVEEDHDQDSLEDQLRNMRKNNADLMDQVKQMQKGNDGKMDPAAAMKMLQKLQGGSGGGLGGLKGLQALSGKGTGGDGTMSGTIKKLISPYKSMPRSQIIDGVKKMTAKKPYGKFLEKNPKILEFYADTMQSSEALPSAAGMLQDRKKLYIFSGLNVLIIIFGSVYKRMTRHKKGFFGPLLKRLFILYSARIALLVAFYGNELGPIWRLFLKRFF
jgi:hypothetical protein